MTPYDVLRLAHLTAGIFAFVVAPLVLVSRTGSALHRRLGWLYLAPMSFAAATAAVLAAAAKGNTPFVAIGPFSLFLGISGQRALRAASGTHAARTDHAFVVMAMVGFAVMLGYAGLLATQGRWIGLPVFAFGCVGAVLAVGNARRLWRPAPVPASPAPAHLARMVSSYIAAVSAFSVVNLPTLPLPVRVLWPAAVGLLLLLLWRRSWTKRLHTLPPRFRPESAGEDGSAVIWSTRGCAAPMPRTPPRRGAAGVRFRTGALVSLSAGPEACVFCRIGRVVPRGRSGAVSTALRN